MEYNTIAPVEKAGAIVFGRRERRARDGDYDGLFPEDDE